MLKKSILLMIIVSLIFTIPVMAEEGAEKTPDPKNKVAAVVNGQEIMLDEVDNYANMQQIFMTLYRTDQEFTQLFLQSEEGQEIINKFRKRKIDGLIEKELLKQEAEERGLTLSEDQKEEIFQSQVENVKQQNNMTEEQLVNALNQQGIESLDQYKQMFLENNKDNLLINALRQEVISGINITEDQARSYYDENIDEYKHDEEVKASHILLDEESTAQEVLDKVESGASFASLAQEYSTGPSADSGGNLGFISKGDMVPSFEEAAFNLDVGEVTSSPVESRFGFHIIKVTDKREAGTTPFSEVKDEIKQELRNKQQQEEWNNFVEQLKEEAEIEKKL